jgi:tetratricopeptide (TPR) repeat protein
MATVALAPDSVEARCLLADLYVQQSRIAAAFDQVNQCQETHPSAIVLCTLGVCLAHSGQNEQAARVIDQLFELSTTEYVDPRLFARIYLALGNASKALEFVQKMLEERSPLAMFLELDPACDPLRSDPRFRKLLAKSMD